MILSNTSAICIATAPRSSGLGAVTPTGTITFTTNWTGTFSSTTCTLSAGSCSVTYTPTVVGHALITGTYGGDSVHSGSSGTFTLASTISTSTTSVACSPSSVPENTTSWCRATVIDAFRTGGSTATGN